MYGEKKKREVKEVNTGRHADRQTDRKRNRKTEGYSFCHQFKLLNNKIPKKLDHLYIM